MQEESDDVQDRSPRCCRWIAAARRRPTCRSRIADSGDKTGGLYGVYVQDEWRILPTVTINGGLRFDGVDQYTHGTQLSPRLNVVWKPTDTTTLHIGYARYFVPPPFELVGQHDRANSPAPPLRPTVNAEQHGESRSVRTISMSASAR